MRNRDQTRDRAKARRRKRKAAREARLLRPYKVAVDRPTDGEPLIAYGARCSWWDAKENATSRDSGYAGIPGLPCCPHCSGVLFEVEESVWHLGVAERKAFGWAAERDDYEELVAWSRGKCFASPEEMLAAWLKLIESAEYAGTGGEQ